MYQQLKDIGFRDELPPELQPVLDRLILDEAAMAAESRIVSDANNCAAFMFIRIKPVRLENPVTLFAEITPTRQIQEIALCRAVWDESLQEWVPDEDHVLFVAHMASSTFSESVMGTEVRMSPVTFVNFNHMQVPPSHDVLSPKKILDWISETSSVLSDIQQCQTNIAKFQSLLSSDAKIAALRVAASSLGLDGIAPKSELDLNFVRTLMHECMGKVTKDLRGEVISEVCRTTTSQSINKPPLLSLSMNENTQGTDERYHELDALRMPSSHAMSIDVSCLLAQLKIIELASNSALVATYITPSQLETIRNTIQSRLQRISLKTGTRDRQYIITPKLSAGCVEFSRPSGDTKFFGSEDNFGYCVEMSFGFAFASVQDDGTVRVVRPNIPHAKVSMTSSQFVELLQSSQIGSWTKCTLKRVREHQVPFPREGAAPMDGRLSQKDIDLSAEHSGIKAKMSVVREIMMSKPFNAASRERLASLLSQLSNDLDALKQKAMFEMDNHQSEVTKEHRLRLEKSVTEVLKVSRQLSASAPEKIHDSLLMLMKNA